MKNSDRFIEAYNRIDDQLRKITGLHSRDEPFSLVVTRASESSPCVRASAFDLRKYGRLRNAIVHESRSGEAIAEPHDRVVLDIERIASLLTQPPKVFPMFKADVLKLNAQDSVALAVQAMLENDFSQLPVYGGTGFMGLLTGTSIARWLGAKVSEGIIDLEGTPVSDALDCAEYINNYEFISRDATLFEVIERFHNRERTKEALEALLITHSGQPHEDLMGIITTWDLSRIHPAISP